MWNLYYNNLNYLSMEFLKQEGCRCSCQTFCCYLQNRGFLIICYNKNNFLIVLKKICHFKFKPNSQNKD